MMPLSEKDRVERQVLRYLNFHGRSPVPLRCDGETCGHFECRDVALFSSILKDMHGRKLFRILPSPGRTVEAVKTILEEEEGPEGFLEEPSVLQRLLEAGVMAMITAEGEKRFRELKKTTSRVRLRDYLKEEAASEPGSWMHSDRPTS